MPIFLSEKHLYPLSKLQQNTTSNLNVMSYFDVFFEDIFSKEYSRAHFILLEDFFLFIQFRLICVLDIFAFSFENRNFPKRKQFGYQISGCDCFKKIFSL